LLEDISMAKEIIRRNGTTSEHSAFTGAEAEITVDTDKSTVVVHDGATTGGFPVAREDMANVTDPSFNTVSANTVNTGQGDNELYEMDQNVKTTDDVVFNQVTANSYVGISSYEDQDALDLFNATGSAPVYACRAWVLFSSSFTAAIRDSGNVSSVTDNGTGEFRVNFTNSMPDSNYSFAATSAGGTTNQSVVSIVDGSNFIGSGFVDILVRDLDETLQDRGYITFNVFR